MEWEKRNTRIAGVAAVCALVFCLSQTSLPGQVAQILSDPRAVAVMLYLESGYLLRSAPVAQPTEPTQPTEQTLPQPSAPGMMFTAEDAALVEVNSVCGYQADVPALLEMPLQWDLTENAPTVLILHTHTTESYQKTGDYVESSAYRTLDEGYNMVAVGEALARVLEAGGVKVIHDKTIYDYPSYNSAYGNARSGIRQVLEQYPQISLVLDLHRDSVEQKGEQMAFSVEQNGESVARLMMVVGTDAGGLKHPDWPENMSLAVKLHAGLEKLCPGICRPISFRKQRFNQDLSPGALIVEVGAAGNTHAQALAAAELLGEAVLALAQGTA